VSEVCAYFDERSDGGSCDDAAGWSSNEKGDASAQRGTGYRYRSLNQSTGVRSILFLVGHEAPLVRARRSRRTYRTECPIGRAAVDDEPTLDAEQNAVRCWRHHLGVFNGCPALGARSWAPKAWVMCQREPPAMKVATM
jgi:hypothetical protein